MSTNQEKAQLTIRCALQSFSDYNVECELEWTVLQLKQYLARTLDFKPEVERQRLIYAGRYLENTQTIDEVIRMSQMNMQRPSGEQLEKQVIHMVYNSGKQGQMPNNNEGIRRRANVGNTGSSQNLQQFAVPNVSSQPPMMMPMYDPNVQQSHEAWMAAYQNYVGQMMHFYQNGGFMQHGMQMNYGLWNSTPNQYPTFGQQQQFATNQQQFYGIPYGPQAIPVPVPVNQPNQQQQQVPFIANPQPNNPPIDVAAAQMPDFLDLIYKSIRFALLAMIVYLYSSFERFISVLCIVALFWFVHARRGQQREQNGEPMAGDRVREQDPNQNNVDAAADNNNQPGNDGEADVNAPNAQPTVANSPPPTVNNTMGVYSGWNVFWTTIQSFFASLIPENPAPLDIN